MAKNLTLHLGLLAIGVKSDKATDAESEKTTFTACAGTEEKPHPVAKVNGRMICSDADCGRTAPSWHSFAKGVAKDDGTLALLSRAEVSEANAPVSEMVLSFHRREAVLQSTVAGEMVNNLLPQKGHEKAYALLHQTLVEHPELVVATIWAPSTKNAMWILDVFGDRLVASSRCWPEDMRAFPAIPEAVVSELERAQMEMFVTASTEDFDPAKYRDVAREARAALIESKDGEAVAGDTGTKAGTPVDIVAALTASMPKQKKTTAKRKAA